MAAQDEGRKRHFILRGASERKTYRYPPGGGGGASVIPERDRAEHGNLLLGKIESLTGTMAEARAVQEAAGAEEGFGLQVVFESFPDIELAFESLAREGSGIELFNVRQSDHLTYATVFVPDGKLPILENLIHAYLNEEKDTTTGPKNSKLLNAISEIRAATISELWTDDPAVFPTSDNEAFWWEVWLPVRGDRQAVVAQFRRQAELLEFRVANGELQFPERSVLLVYGTAGQMKRSVMILNSIAELRRGKKTADFFDSMPNLEQHDWLSQLMERLSFPDDDALVPHICILDTGVNYGHPLIARRLSSDDAHTVEPAWGTDDANGHGTEMAGLALLGNLTDALNSQTSIEVAHRLESVKLLPEDGANGGDAKHHGYLTIEATARPEITAPLRSRVFAMAVTARDNRDRGRPSSWSAAIDSLASDAEDNGQTRRLFIVSAGNINDLNAWAMYPESNRTDSVHDPAQSWNALTVGAMTDLADITDSDCEDYQPIAPAGGLSPFSTTSVTWDSQWPLKPDVVFEGGNAGMDAYSACVLASLSLLTTNSKPQERLFTTTNATSAATMLAARMAAALMSDYPELWPETIRALIVHSAEWTEAMRQTFLPASGRPNKTDIGHLVRHCGFGVPDLERAAWSIENSLTMVCEDELHPFKREGSNTPTLRDMNLHRLPWPLPELEALGETEVEMRVTLSYFIEPNPSERGFSTRYSYESHALRFDVKRPLETTADFQARINAAARGEEERSRSGEGDPSWLLGTRNRHKGSLHSDVWIGTAADLASRGVIGVFPATGWWKTRVKHERYNLATRYALLVSIRAPEVDVELYTAVRNRIEAEVEIAT